MKSPRVEEAGREDLPALQLLAERAGADAWSERGWADEFAAEGARIRVVRRERGDVGAFLVTRQVAGEG